MPIRATIDSDMSRFRYSFIILFIVIAGIGVAFRDRVAGLIAKIPDRKELVSQIHSLVPISQIRKEIITASPLRAYFDSVEGSLTREGVIYWTNAYRTHEAPAIFKENEKLNHAAEQKLRDMFVNQYFAHASPEDVGPSHWVEQEGYQYIVIGENLALGNYATDKDLVDAWMASPGHRENMMNPRFQEIGVAVGKGTFEGRTTWLAVQEFGKPASSCPQSDSFLKKTIDANEHRLDRWESDLALLSSQVKTMDQKEIEKYNTAVDKYNTLANEYNDLVEKTKRLTTTYNGQVSAYNACAKNP